MPINYVSALLGHTNLTTTSRYLNINRRELHRAMQRFEESRQSKAEFAQSLHKNTDPQPAVVQQPDDASPRKSQLS
jgi:indole-3-glycerol phosphate synthase